MHRTLLIPNTTRKASITRQKKLVLHKVYSATTTEVHLGFMVVYCQKSSYLKDTVLRAESTVKQGLQISQIPVF